MKSAFADRDESGGAASLWVVLMVPIAAFAAAVAMAGPQRVAAESSMSEATDDLAALAVAWRGAQDAPAGAVSAFPLECAISDADALELASLSSSDPAGHASMDAQLREYLQNCEWLRDAIVRDLGYLGVDVNSLRGFYSDSLSTAAVNAAAPCVVSPTLEVRDAVYVAAVADWTDASWAAAQVWPEGIPMGSASIGRLVENTAASPDDPGAPCSVGLDVMDDRGRARWLSGDLSSRDITESVRGRTAFGG